MGIVSTKTHDGRDVVFNMRKITVEGVTGHFSLSARGAWVDIHHCYNGKRVWVKNVPHHIFGDNEFDPCVSRTYADDVVEYIARYIDRKGL